MCRKTLDPVWEEEFWLDISAEMDPMINVQVRQKKTISGYNVKITDHYLYFRCMTRTSWGKMRLTAD